MESKIIDINFFAFIIIIIISFLIGFRDYSVGTDTINYVEIYSANINFTGFEPGFNFFISTFNLLTPNPILLFAFICLLISIFYYLTFQNIDYLEKNNLTFLLLFFSLIFVSSWYISNVTNGLRQGVSLSILYYTLTRHFVNKKYFIFLIFYFIALMFHISSIFLLPFLILYITISFRNFFYLWILLSIFYMLNLNEKILFEILSFFGFVDFYYLIKNYGLPEYNYYGFNIYFFLYTIFFPLISLIIYYFYKKDKSPLIFPIIKLYFMLCMPYFLLGFANYSNRYGLIAWAFIPFMQLIIIKQLELSRVFLYLISIMFFCLGIIYFYIIRLNWFFLLT